MQHLGFYADNYDEWKLYAQERAMEILYELEVEDAARGKGTSVHNPTFSATHSKPNFSRVRRVGIPNLTSHPDWR